MNHEAIYALYSNAVSIIDKDNVTTVIDSNGNEVTIDQSAVDEWVAPDQYARDRVSEYPSIGDQLDALFHAGVFPADMAATIQAVKDKYPKGGA